MEDTEWEQIANKFIDSLEQEKSEENINHASKESIEKFGGLGTSKDVLGLSASTGPIVSSSKASLEQRINESEDAICDMIKKMDPKCSLTIHRYLKEMNDDPVIFEYGKKLAELQFVPSEPGVVELKYYATKHKSGFELSYDCQRNCILMLVSYFKCCEIKLKLKKAENEKNSLFEVSAVPEFMKSQILFTIAGHERFSTLRNCLCIQMQRVAATENEFVMELLLISICYCLMQELKQKQKNDGLELIDRIKTYFVSMYLRVKLEYETNYCKEVDAESSTTEHNLPDYPSWRVEGKSAPVFFERDLSLKILNRFQKSNFGKFDMKQAIKFLCEQNRF